MGRDIRERPRRTFGLKFLPPMAFLAGGAIVGFAASLFTGALTPIQAILAGITVGAILRVLVRLEGYNDAIRGKKRPLDEVAEETRRLFEERTRHLLDEGAQET